MENNNNSRSAPPITEEEYFEVLKSLNSPAIKNQLEPGLLDKLYGLLNYVKEELGFIERKSWVQEVRDSQSRQNEIIARIKQSQGREL